MINYEDLIWNMATTVAPSIIVFLMLALIFDYMRQMLFSNK